MTHTPGPWNISRDKRTIFASTDGAGVLIRGIEQAIPQIAYICGNGFGATFDQQNANARLITAAPELLEALEALIANSDHISPFGSEVSSVKRVRLAGKYLKALDNAKAAIRKAKGE